MYYDEDNYVVLNARLVKQVNLNLFAYVPDTKVFYTKLNIASNPTTNA